MEEIWKDIGIIEGVDYTGLYQVSNLGNVKSLYDGRHKKFRELIITPRMVGWVICRLPFLRMVNENNQVLIVLWQLHSYPYQSI